MIENILDEYEYFTSEDTSTESLQEIKSELFELKDLFKSLDFTVSKNLNTSFNTLWILNICLCVLNVAYACSYKLDDQGKVLKEKLNQMEDKVDQLERQLRISNKYLFKNGVLDKLLKENNDVPFLTNVDERYSKSHLEEKKNLFVNQLQYYLESFEEEFASSRILETVQISPTYFSTDQISKLNNELKEIAETYQGTNIMPIIEVVHNTNLSDDHPVMKKLCKGVVYEKLPKAGSINTHYAIRIGTDGFKRAQIRDLLAENPELTLYDVVREGLKSTNEWRELSRMYNLLDPVDVRYTRRYPD